MAPSFLEMIHHAWITPGIHPRIQRKIFIQTSAWHPVLKKTAMGGMNIARKYRASSLGDDTREVMFFLGVVCWKSVVLWRGGGLLRHIFSCSDDI
jgi:hypothetical protein